ncbi:50S ribosomal protein L4 [Linum grandiflorum]
MAAKGILRSLGSSLSSLRRCHGGSNQASLDWTSSFHLGSATSLSQGRFFNTSIITPESSDASFPSDLLSSPKTVFTPPDRQIGLYQDLVIPVTNFNNQDKGFMVLAGDVFDVPIRKDIIHRVVRWQLAKRQQGTHSTKTISEVSGTGRKPWNQKGTGRARHGSLRGPQFRGGCVMHGPKPRSHAFKLNKKFRRLGLKIALTARAAEGKVYIVSLYCSQSLSFFDISPMLLNYAIAAAGV